MAWIVLPSDVVWKLGISAADMPVCETVSWAREFVDVNLLPVIRERYHANSLWLYGSE